MSIPLRVVDPRPVEPEPGMMWRYPPGDADGRECWWIVLPCPAEGRYMEINWRTTDKASAPPHGMWDVTGTPPLITVTPSIDVERWEMRDGVSVREGSWWHGFITNGELVG